MIHAFAESGAAIAAAAEWIVRSSESALAERGAFRIGLSGGRTPAPLYQRLANAPIDWKRTVILFADERAVPPEHTESNYRLVRETLLDPLGIADRARRMRAESHDLEAAAREYEPWLAEPIDLLLLGVGADGHVASIFPRSPAAVERVRRVLAVRDGPKPPPERLTVSPRVIEEAREVMVLAFGDEKARAVAEALEREGSPFDLPARWARGRDWYLDGDASRLLDPGLRP